MTLAARIEVELRAKVDDLNRNMRSGRREVERTSESIRTGLSKASKQSTVDLETLVRQIQKVSKQTAKVGIDDEQAKAKLQAVQDDLQLLAKQAADPEIQLDSAVFDAKFDKVKADLAAIDGRAAELKLNVDNEGVQRLRDLQRSVGTLQDKYVKVFVDTRDANTDVDALSGALQGLAQDVVVNVSTPNAEAATSALQEFRDQVFEIAKGALLLAPALLPPLAQITVAAAGAGGALFSLGSGIGLFAFAAKTNLTGVADAFTAVGDAQEKLKTASSLTDQAAAFAAYGKALAPLSVEQRQVVLGLQQLKNQWSGLSATVRPDTFFATSQAFRILNSVMGQARPLLQAAGHAIAGASLEFAQFFETNGQWKNFTSVLSGTVGPTITNLSRSLIGLLSTLSTVGAQLAPLGVAITGGLAAGLERLSRWVEGDTFRRGLQGIVAYARENGPLVGETLKNIAEALTGILRSAAPLGPSMLQIVNVLARVLAVVANSPFGPWIIGLTSLALAGRRVYAAYAALPALFARFVTAITPAVFQMSVFTSAVLGNAAAMSLLGPRAAAAAAYIRGFFTSVRGAASFGVMAVGMGLVVDQLIQLGTQSDAAKSKIQALNAQFDHTTIRGLEDNIAAARALVDSLDGIGERTKAVLKNPLRGGQVLETLNKGRDNVKALTDELNRMKAAQGNVTELGRRFSLTEQQVKDLADANRIDLSSSMVDLDARFGQLTGQTDEGKRALAQYKQAQDQMPGAIANTAQEVGTQITAFSDLSTQAKITGQQLLDTAAQNARYALEQASNVKKLFEQGILKPAQIQELVKQGPAAVAAAASLSKTQLQKFANDMTVIAEGNYTTFQTLTLNGSNAIAAAAVANMQAAKDRIAGALGGLLDTPLKKALSDALVVLANFNLQFGNDMSAGVAAQREQVLDAFIATLPAPLQEAVRQALPVALQGGGDIAGNIALGLANRYPAVVDKITALSTAVQTIINGIQGKTITIAAIDKATSILKNIPGAVEEFARKLHEAGFYVPQISIADQGDPNVVGPGTTRRARGGPIPGYDRFDRDTVNAKLTRGEWVIRRSAVDRYGHAAMAAVNSGRARIGFATGGPVGFAAGGTPSGYVLDITARANTVGFSTLKGAAAQVANSLLSLAATAGSAGNATSGAMTGMSLKAAAALAGTRSQIGATSTSLTTFGQTATNETTQASGATSGMSLLMAASLATARGQLTATDAALVVYGATAAAQTGRVNGAMGGMSLIAAARLADVRGQLAVSEGRLVNFANTAGSQASRAAGAVGLMAGAMRNALVAIPALKTIKINATASANFGDLGTAVANGGILDGGIPQPFANGGMLPPQATIKPGRGAGLVQWAEGETGGEAFIPLNPRKRQRSTQILGTVADRFGYTLTPQPFANGGLTGSGGLRELRIPTTVDDDDFPNRLGTWYANYENEVRRRAQQMYESLLLSFAGGSDYGGVLPWIAAVGHLIQRKFGVRDVGGKRSDPFPDHPSGRALDLMVYGDRAKGDAINQFLLANARNLGTVYDIWQQAIWYPGRGPRGMADRGSPTANHRDHVHFYGSANPPPGFSLQSLAAYAGGGGGLKSGGVRDQINQAAIARGWGGQLGPLDNIVQRESGFNATAKNPSSTAYGPFQMLTERPGTPLALMIQHGLDYIASRYGNPANAWAFWSRHGWYEDGGIRDSAGRDLESFAGGGFRGSAASAAFIRRAVAIGSQKKSLANQAIQHAYGYKPADGFWSYDFTDWAVGHDPKAGYKGADVPWLQAALHRKQTGTISSSDLGALKAYLDKNVWTKDNNSPMAIAQADQLTAGFQANILTLVKRGYAPLADYLQKQGADQAWRTAGQYAKASDTVLRRVQDQVVRTAAREDSKFGDALGLASKLAQYGSKVGLLGLASRSGTSVGDTLGLITSYPDVFAKLGTSASTLLADLDRLKRGEQPIPAYAAGAFEIKQDHVALVHKGETIAPRAYAEPWRENMRPAAQGRAGISISVGAVRVQVDAAGGMSAAEVQTAVETGVVRALNTVTDTIATGAGTN